MIRHLTARQIQSTWTPNNWLHRRQIGPRRANLYLDRATYTPKANQQRLNRRSLASLHRWHKLEEASRPSRPLQLSTRTSPWNKAVNHQKSSKRIVSQARSWNHTTSSTLKSLCHNNDQQILKSRSTTLINVRRSTWTPWSWDTVKTENLTSKCKCG